jgi:hypothetical protein
MAKAEAPAKKDPGKKPKKKSGKLGMFTILILLCFAMPFMLPTVVLLLAGLIPTYVALSTDNDPQKSGAVSVGAMNFAGIVPFIIDLWSKGQTMPNALHILGDANSWVVILGAAAIGQLVVYAIPQALATLTLAQAESRVKAMRKNLTLLQESWGPEVATIKPIDKIVME